jgi:hypothetical protein
MCANTHQPRRRFRGEKTLARGGAYLFCNHLEARECARPERSHNGDVRRITSSCHENAADAGMVMACIERIPLAAEIALEPGTEIHRSWVRRHTDIAEVSGTIARRYVHAAAQRDREVCEVTAHTSLLCVGVECRLGRAGMGIAKRDVVMNVIADRLHQWPALLMLSV